MTSCSDGLGASTDITCPNRRSLFCSLYVTPRLTYSGYNNGGLNSRGTGGLTLTICPIESSRKEASSGLGFLLRMVSSLCLKSNSTSAVGSLSNSVYELSGLLGNRRRELFLRLSLSIPVAIPELLSGC